ncbi:MAG: Stk1 family PASTA domain-containing Ser/Thr kinase [Lachnospiraceae bacterium]|nr:Stk1 family PASTA domain-containing Ser/Thr kinase [Lachnospiraceae bacterium]
MLEKGMFVADRYEVIERVGAGGMSDVYKAMDHILGRVVAIKVLKQEFSEDTNFVRKFRSEAQSAAGLEHPNIVNIYDVGSQDGMYFIVMEYVEGITLKTYIEKKGQLSYKEAVSIAIQVGRGIEAAHAKNIIHRDIKPQNILISTDGKAKVTDFGIARAVSNNTISADVMGSVHYASPEQARNGFVDGKSDIYSLGIVMYEMVTGRVPFDGETTVAVALGHLQEEMVNPSVYASNLPISLEKIILKCTQKSVERRYQSIGDLMIDLKKVLISPDEDFVVIAATGEAEKTRVISDDELGRIKDAKSVGVIPSSRKKYEDDEDEYDDDEDEDDEFEEGFLNPKLEKIVTGAGIAAAVIIIIIILYLLGSILGVFGSSKKSKTKDTETETTVTETETTIDTSASLTGNTETESSSSGVSMISVLGSTYDEAKTKLNELGLGIQQTATEYSDRYSEGQIMAQDVAEGTNVDLNTTIKVTVSKGAEPVSVPAVTGLESTTAMSTITSSGLSCTESNITYEYSSTVASGKVISQSPIAGASAVKGDTVAIVVSKGAEQVQVPDVTTGGVAEATAKSTLTNLGFSVTTSTAYSDTVTEGNVISQSIAAGTNADKGATISLVISLGKETTTYSCSYTIPDPEDDEVSSAKIVLYNSDGGKIKTIKDVSAGDFPYTVSVTGIENYTSGTIVITWTYDDGSTSQETINVTFTQE